MQMRGIDLAATDFNHRALIQKFARADAELDIIILHADAHCLMKNPMKTNKGSQVTIYEGSPQKLK